MIELSILNVLAFFQDIIQDINGTEGPALVLLLPDFQIVPGFWLLLELVFKAGLRSWYRFGTFI